MEIEKKIKQSITFDKLEYGDVFIDEDGDVMIVTDTDYGLGLNEDYYGYAVNLQTGSHYGYGAKDMIIKVVAKLIVTD